jgi:hypothetical protein
LEDGGGGDVLQEVRASPIAAASSTVSRPRGQHFRPLVVPGTVAARTRAPVRSARRSTMAAATTSPASRSRFAVRSTRALAGEGVQGCQERGAALEVSDPETPWSSWTPTKRAPCASHHRSRAWAELEPRNLARRCSPGRRRPPWRDQLASRRVAAALAPLVSAWVSYEASTNQG